MAQQHGSYYVPEYSALPIIGSIGLLLTAVGSLNFNEFWGQVSTALGVFTLITILASWLTSVVRESRAGLYDKQMDRTFRWGMFWFIFCELNLFFILYFTLIYVRAYTLPWLAGTGAGGSLLTHYLLWPNFQAQWPLTVNPAPSFGGLHVSPLAWGLPALNTAILLISAVVTTLAAWALKKGRMAGANSGLLVSIILGIAFLALQFHYCALVIKDYGLTAGSGIYGSLFFIILGFHSVHVVIGLILMAVILLRSFKQHFTLASKHFAFEAAVWFWCFITVMWLVNFILMFGF